MVKKEKNLLLLRLVGSRSRWYRWDRKKVVVIVVGVGGDQKT